LSGVPTDVLGLFQACVINYHRRLNEWFGFSLADRVHVGGMMSIVYDLNPSDGDVAGKRLRRELGREAAEFLLRYCAQIKNEFDQLQRPAQFSIGIEYRLALTKKPGEADIVLSQSTSGGSAVQVVEVPKDPSKSHPCRQKEVLDELKRELTNVTLNQHDIQSVIKAHDIRKRPEYFYKGIVKGSPVQYSPAFVAWLLQQYRRDQQFFIKARAAKISSTMNEGAKH